MNPIIIFYLVTSIASVIVMVPQIEKLLKVKKSDEFSLVTWAIWMLYQVSALMYAISLNAMPYVLVSSLWIAFYAAMLVLIVKYRPQSKSKRKSRR